nr:reverse transcriptase domain-containing protein [Tanacetum cinerariifolium]
MMVDQRTMAQLLQAPTDGYENVIVVPAISADNFELKHGLLTLVPNKQFFGHDKKDPHAYIRYFNKITSTLKFPKRFDESFSEAWDRFKDLLRTCPHHGFSELHQLDMFYNALNSKDQDSLNSAACGNFLDKMPLECLAIIESKSKVCYLCNKTVVAKVSTNTSTSGILPDVAELKDTVKALLLNKKSQNQAPATVKVIEESCVTCGGAHSYHNFPATDGNIYHDNIQEFVSQASAHSIRAESPYDTKWAKMAQGKNGLHQAHLGSAPPLGLRNEITNFQQRYDESFSEALDRFKDLLRACPHHGFSELHQLDTFYNELNSKDQDSLNFAVG